MSYDPFDLDTPAVAAISGGRTSGYMLHRLLQARSAREVRYVFCNTGKERPETLDFLHEIETRWGVPLVWLEYRHEPGRHFYVVVNYETASRDGTPFNHAIAARGFCPNRIARYCTAELKVKTMWRWAKDQGLAEQGYTKAVGLRHDEPERVRRLTAGNGETRASEEIVCPLHEAGVNLEEVMTFWKGHPFDLQLAPHEGNCDLCFLKRKGSLLEIMHRRPDLAAWWIAQESGTGLFRSPRDRPRYELLLADAEQPQLFDDDEDDISCACTD